MNPLLFLAVFFDLWLPPYLPWTPVLVNPPVKIITKHQAWNRIHPPKEVSNARHHLQQPSRAAHDPAPDRVPNNPR